MPKLRVLVVDDSAFMRGAIARLLEGDGRFEVVGQAKDGQEALKLVRETRPDVISMDFNMPGLDGAAAARAILEKQAVPIVMLSAHTSEGARATLQALAAGAVDFVTKPDGEVSVNLGRVKQQLCEKLIAAAGANLEGSRARLQAPVNQPASRSFEHPARRMPPGLKALAIGASTGGPAALLRLLPKLAVHQDVVVLVVQHMPAGFTSALAAQLAEVTAYPVRESRAGELLEGGVAYLARGGFHLVVKDGRLEHQLSDFEHGVRPAVDPLFQAVAQQFGRRAIGVLLTGMGRDGALGLGAIKAAGGFTLAQDESSCVVYGMPRTAVQMGVVDAVAPLERIPLLLNRLLSPPQ